jgi:hypothetical protein
MWIDRYQNVGRAAVWVLLLSAALGPWAYTSDGVPPAEWCQPPNFLDSGRCVKLVSGVDLLSFLAMAGFSMSAGLLTGATVFPDRAREYFLVMLFATAFLPFLTTLLRLRRQASWRSGVIHLLACGLAAFACVLVLVGNSPHSLNRLWGAWLYLILTVFSVGMEIVMLAAGAKRQ